MLLVFGWACDEGGGIAYEGETGAPVPTRVIDGIPAVELSFDGSPPSWTLIDSGAPLTLLSEHAFGAGETVREGTLEGLGPVFPGFQVAVTPLFSAEDPCAVPVPAGLLGGDLLAYFRLRIDFDASELTLFDDALQLDDAPGSAQQVDFELRGGGRVALGDVRYEVGATRVVVPLQIEGMSVFGLVDTGATLTLLDQSLVAELDPAGRPQRCCVGVGGFEQRSTQLPLLRLRRVQLGPVEVSDLSAVALPAEPLLEALSREVGREIRVILGGSFLRRFNHELDYPRRQWTLWAREGGDDRFDDYVSAGFSYCRARSDSGQLLVLDVYEDTDASSQGVRPGDRVVQLDGRDVAFLDDVELQRLLGTPRAEPLSVEFLGSGGTVLRQLRVEDVLPPF